MKTTIEYKIGRRKNKIKHKEELTTKIILKSIVGRVIRLGNSKSIKIKDIQDLKEDIGYDNYHITVQDSESGLIHGRVELKLKKLSKGTQSQEEKVTDTLISVKSQIERQIKGITSKTRATKGLKTD